MPASTVLLKNLWLTFGKRGWMSRISSLLKEFSSLELRFERNPLFGTDW